MKTCPRGHTHSKRQCLECQKANARRRWAAGAGQFKDKHSYHIERRYGLTGAQYAAEVAKRGGRCDICGRVPESKSKIGQRLHVDHDHVTGKVRGLLCLSCNMRAGILEGKLVQETLDYLQRNR